MNQTRRKANMCNRRWARENEEVTYIWLANWKWRDIIKPIAKPNNAKQRNQGVPFEAQLKVTLITDSSYRNGSFDASPLPTTPLFK